MANTDLLTLENIRIKLGMSQRQICKLLKVDPSAWTRWMKSKTGAPAYVHQALNWYVQLVEQNPDFHAPQLFEKKLEEVTRMGEQKIQSLKREFQELKAQGANKKEALDELGNKIHESFENILLKFRDQMAPLKTLEVESLKYENIRLKEHVQDLSNKMKTLFDKMDGVQNSKAQFLAQFRKVKKKVTKGIKRKMKSKVKKAKPKKRPLKKNKPKLKKKGRSK